MINFKTSFLLIFLAISIYAKAQNKLTIEIINLRSDKGFVSLELFDSNHKSLLGKKGTILNKRCTIIIDNLKPSKYAVRYIHDEKSNDKLDTNWMGIPSEGYGFSNNAYGNFGPYSFDKWLFNVNGDTKIILITKKLNIYTLRPTTAHIQCGFQKVCKCRTPLLFLCYRTKTLTQSRTVSSRERYA